MYTLHTYTPGGRIQTRVLLSELYFILAFIVIMNSIGFCLTSLWFFVAWLRCLSMMGELSKAQY